METPEVYESDSDEESVTEEKGEELNADSAVEIEEVASGSGSENDDDEDDDNDSGAGNSGSEDESGMGFPHGFRFL